MLQHLDRQVAPERGPVAKLRGFEAVSGLRSKLGREAFQRGKLLDQEKSVLAHTRHQAVARHADQEGFEAAPLQRKRLGEVVQGRRAGSGRIESALDAGPQLQVRRRHRRLMAGKMQQSPRLSDRARRGQSRQRGAEKVDGEGLAQAAAQIPIS